jgi:hypothetical protein
MIFMGVSPQARQAVDVIGLFVTGRVEGKWLAEVDYDAIGQAAARSPPHWTRMPIYRVALSSFSQTVSPF